MKPIRSNRFALAALASAALVFTVCPARAANLTWDTVPGTVGAGNGTITGGAGNWNTTPSLGNWTPDGGTTNVAWVNNSPPDSATFQATGGAVAQAGIVVNKITFATAGYSVTGGTLTLAGPSPTITTTADATITSALAGTAGMTKAGAAVLGISTKATYTGNTIVSAGILSLNGGGGGSGTIRGTVNVDSGGTLRINTGDATGFNVGAASLSVININTGGTLSINTAANQTLGSAVLNLNGGTVTGITNSNLDFFNGGSALNSLASNVTSTISGTQLRLRQAPNLTVTVAKGTTPSGIDLDINSVLANDPGFASSPLIKAGTGTLRLNAINTIASPTNVTAGSLIVGRTGSLANSDISVSSGAVFRLAGASKTVQSLNLADNTTLALAASKTAKTTVTGTFTANGTVSVRPEFLDFPMTGDAYTLATAASVAGTPTFTLDTSALGATRVTGTVGLVGNDLQLNVTTGGAALLWTNNAGTGNWNLNGDANFSNAGSPDVFKNVDSVTFDGTAPGTITLLGTLSPSAVNVTAASGDYTFAGSGSIAAGTLTKSGAGALTVTTTNTHLATVISGGTFNANSAGAAGNGTTTVSGGTLNLGNAGALGTGRLVLTGGAFDNTTGAPATLTNVETWNGTFAYLGTQNLTASGAITLAGNSQVNVNANTLIASGGISGAFNVTAGGAGTLQLAGTNTFSGTTNVTGSGRLLITGTVRNTAALNAGPGSTLELGGTNLFTNGHGTALPATQVITVNGGTLLFNAQTDFRFGSVTLNDGATWTSNRTLASYDGLLANTTAGAAVVTVGGTGTSVMNGTGGIHIQDVQTFDVADTNPGPATDLSVNMILGTQGTIGGAAGGIRKTGAGTMVLNNTNLYTGATIVEAGKLVVGSAGSIAGSDVTVNAAAFQVQGIDKTLKSLTLNDGAILTLPANYFGTTNLTGNLTTSGAITLRPLFTDRPLSGDIYNFITAANFVNGGTYTVDLASQGTTRVTATASADGGNKLVLTIGSGAADLVWSNSAGTGIWNLNGDANFKNGAATDVFKTYDSVTFGNTAAGTVQLAGTLYPGSVTVDSSADYTFAGSGKLGGGELVKSGTSTLNLPTAQSPSSVTLNAGTLNLGSSASVGTGRLTITGGTLNNGSGAPIVLTNQQFWSNAFAFTGSAISATGAVTLNSATNVNVGPAGLTVSGPITGGSGELTKSGAGTLVLNGATASTLTAGFNVSAGTAIVTTGTGATAVTIGAGPDFAELVLDGNQSFNRVGNFGSILIGSKGTLTVNGVNPLPNAAVAASLTVEAGGVARFVSGGSTITGVAGESHGHVGLVTLNGGTLDLAYSGTGTAYEGESFQLDGNVVVAGNTPSTIQFGTGATVANAGIGLPNGVARTFTVADVTNSPAPDLIVTAELENGNAATGSILKDGPGTMLLAGSIAHTYTGSTTIAAGTLAGTGSLAGTLIVEAAGTIAPGNPVGTFATGSATISGTYAAEINGAASDSLAINGDLTLTGATLAVAPAGAGATQPTYVVATYTGNRTGTFAATTGVPAGYTVNYNDALKRVELTTGAGNNYSDYIAQYPGAAGAPGFGQDADSDGIPNGVESVLGTDPSANSAGLTQVSATANSVTFRHTLSNTLPGDVSYRYEWSSDLVEWKPSTVANSAGTVVTIVPTVIVDNAAPATDIVEVVATRTGTASSRIFVRLVAVN